MKINAQNPRVLIRHEMLGGLGLRLNTGRK